MRAETAFLISTALLALALPSAVVSANGTAEALRVHPVTLEGVVTDRNGKPVSGITCTLLDKDGTPYVRDGRPVRDVTDRHGRYVLKATVRKGYRVGYLVPRGALDEAEKKGR